MGKASIVISLLALNAAAALRADGGGTKTMDARSAGPIPPGWVVVSERYTDPRIYTPHWPTRRELTLRNVAEAPFGETVEVTGQSPVPEGWVVVGEKDDGGRNGFYYQRNLQIKNLNGAPFGSRETIIATPAVPRGWNVVGGEMDPEARFHCLIEKRDPGAP